MKYDRYFRGGEQANLWKLVFSGLFRLETVALHVRYVVLAGNDLFDVFFGNRIGKTTILDRIDFISSSIIDFQTRYGSCPIVFGLIGLISNEYELETYTDNRAT